MKQKEKRKGSILPVTESVNVENWRRAPSARWMKTEEAIAKSMLSGTEAGKAQTRWHWVCFCFDWLAHQQRRVILSPATSRCFDAFGEVFSDEYTSVKATSLALYCHEGIGLNDFRMHDTVWLIINCRYSIFVLFVPALLFMCDFHVYSKTLFCLELDFCWHLFS